MTKDKIKNTFSRRTNPAELKRRQMSLNIRSLMTDVLEINFGGYREEEGGKIYVLKSKHGVECVVTENRYSQL